MWKKRGGLVSRGSSSPISPSVSTGLILLFVRQREVTAEKKAEEKAKQPCSPSASGPGDDALFQRLKCFLRMNGPVMSPNFLTSFRDVYLLHGYNLL